MINLMKILGLKKVLGIVIVGLFIGWDLNFNVVVSLLVIIDFMENEVMKLSSKKISHRNFNRINLLVFNICKFGDKM